MIHEPVTLRKGIDFRLELERQTRALRQPRQVIRTNLAAERVCQQIEHEHPAGISLGGGDAFLAAGVNQEDMFGEFCQRTASLVSNADSERALLARLLQDEISVCGF